MNKMIITKKGGNPICYGKEELVNEYFKENFSVISHKIIDKNNYNMGSFNELLSRSDEIIKVNGKVSLRDNVEMRVFFRIEENDVRIPINISQIKKGDIVKIYENGKLLGKYLAKSDAYKLDSSIGCFDSIELGE